MESEPITGLDELDAHLDEVASDLAIPLNAKLFDHVELQLTEANIPPLIPRFLPRLTAILKEYPNDPQLLVSLSIKLLGPVPFAQILSLADQDSLILALRSPAPSANMLAMYVLGKASRSPADVAVVADMPDLLANFLRTWLVSPEVGVGTEGSKVLGKLLEVDSDLPLPAPLSQVVTFPARSREPGQGRLWRRIFSDQDIYNLILCICAGRDAETAEDERQLSLAQGRLLRILPSLAALNFQAVSRSNFPSPTPIHQTNGHASSEQSTTAKNSLLHFAGLSMVNRRDRLMHLSLVDFFEALVVLMQPTLSEPSAYKTETVRGLLRGATSRDAILKEALLSLPDRIAEEEADALRGWIREVLPGEAVRVGGRS